MRLPFRPIHHWAELASQIDRFGIFQTQTIASKLAIPGTASNGTFLSDYFNETLCISGFLNFFNEDFSANVARPLQQYGTTLVEICVGVWGKHSFESRNSDMKRLTIVASAVIAVGAAAPAIAADLPARAPVYTKAPAIVDAAYNWSGFYAGINGGGAIGKVDWTNDGGLGDEGSHNLSGGTVGGQIGYRWQLNSWVFGLEGQGNWADFSGSNASNLSAVFGGPTTNQTKIDAFGLFTGQIGYAWDRTLFYVNGGAAVVDNKFTSVTTGPLGGIDTINNTRWGAAVGAGFEYAFAPNWSVGFQYDHLFLGTKDINDGFIADRIKEDVDLFTARVNYKFGGPLVARY